MLSILSLSALFFSQMSLATAAPQPFVGPKNNFILSASGGISLGAYQAGQLYYQSLFLKENQSFATPVIVTGASAGAINSFLTVLDKCEPNLDPPNESAFWKTWQAIGFRELLPEPKEKSPTSLFSPRILEKTAASLEAIWKKGFKKGCSTIFGVPVTLKDPDTFLLANGLSVQRQSIPLTVKITGMGPGIAPKIENYPILDDELSQAQIYLNHNAAHDFSALKDLLIASAAFPLAFPARSIRICMKRGACTEEKSELKEFIDGGLYENQPLNLGYWISTQAIKQDPKTLFFRHVDADGKVYPSEISTEKKPLSFLQTGFETLEKFVSTSRTKELFSLLSRNPKISSQISNSVAYYPRASEPWGAFFGFFDEGFREFDFLIGMHESSRDLKKTLPRIQVSMKNQSIHLPLSNLESNSKTRASWQRFRCLSSYLENSKDREPVCEQPELYSLKLLAQLSLWKLHYLCHQEGIKTEKWAACSALTAFNNELPLLDPRFQGEDTLPRPDEDDGVYVMRILQRFHYEFDEKEFDREDAPDLQLRKKLQVAVDRLGNSQPLGERNLIKKGGKVVLDYYHYLAPENKAYIQFGELSMIGLQTNHLFPKFFSSNIKLDLGIDSYRISDFFTSEGNETTFAFFLGLAFDLSHFNSSNWQYQVGLDLGDVFAKDQSGCLQAASRKGRTLCNGFVIRPNLSVSFHELVRLSWVPRVSITGETSRRFDHQFSIGFQYGF